MATIGDVLVNLRANTGDFSRPLRQAARDVQLLKGDVAAGKITLGQYAESMGLVRDRLIAARQGFDPTIRQAAQFNAILRQTTPVAERVGLSVRSLRGPLATLAAQSLGANSALGTLGSMLASLSLGSGVGIGVVAGIGAIAFAMKALKSDTEEAMEAYDAWLNKLRESQKSALDLVGKARDATSQQIHELAEQIQRLRPAGVDVSEDEARMKFLMERAKQLRTTYDQIYTSLRTNNRETEKETRRTYELRDAMDVLTQSLNRQLEAYKNRYKLLTISSVLGKQEENPIFAGPSPDTLAKGVEDALKNLDIDKMIPKAVKQHARWIEVGDQIGESLGRGMAGGITSAIFDRSKNIGDILKSIFRTIFEEILTEVIRPFAKKIGSLIGNALAHGGGGGILGAIGAGIGILGTLGVFSRATPGTPVVQVPLSAIPKNPNPIAVARDAQWQSVWSETARVMQTQGVRLQFI